MVILQPVVRKLESSIHLSQLSQGERWGTGHQSDRVLTHVSSNKTSLPLFYWAALVLAACLTLILTATQTSLLGDIT